MESMVFISGATGGFGRMVAVECASRGFHLFLTDQNAQRLQSFCRCLHSHYNIQADYAACDMGDFEARTRLIETLKESGKSFFMLVNVAGIDPEGPFLECPREIISKVFNINLVAALDMIRSLTQLRDAKKPMRILNVCSMGGLFPMPIKAVYAASKRALIDMSRALREELKPLGVTVTALCPAGMATHDVMLKSLAVQGFMSKLTTLQLCTIASKSIDKALKGKALYIPGIVNRVIVGASRLLPTGAVCRLIYRRWQKTYQSFREALDTPA